MRGDGGLPAAARTDAGGRRAAHPRRARRRRRTSSSSSKPSAGRARRSTHRSGTALEASPGDRAGSAARCRWRVPGSPTATTCARRSARSPTASSRCGDGHGARDEARALGERADRGRRLELGSRCSAPSPTRCSAHDRDRRRPRRFRDHRRPRAAEARCPRSTTSSSRHSRVRSSESAAVRSQEEIVEHATRAIEEAKRTGSTSGPRRVPVPLKYIGGDAEEDPSTTDCGPHRGGAGPVFYLATPRDVPRGLRGPRRRGPPREVRASSWRSPSGQTSSPRAS